MCPCKERWEPHAGAYRVFSCDGSTGANTILIAAAEQAYQDGMDIINLCVCEPIRLPDPAMTCAPSIAALWLG